MMIRTTRRTLLGAALALPALPALAQGWAPARPLRFVVPFPPGGATDVVACSANACRRSSASP